MPCNHVDANIYVLSMLSAVRLICHSLAFADPDVCGGGGKGYGAGSPDLPGKSQYWTPPSVNSWTPEILEKVGTLVGL